MVKEHYAYANGMTTLRFVTVLLLPNVNFFWPLLYIGHLKKVVPKVIEMRAGPTGY